MSFSAIWHRRLRYMLSPQLDLYDRIGARFCFREDGPPPKVLDYGCGLGFGMLSLSTHGCRSDVVGVDADASAIEFAHSILGNQFNFFEADALRMGADWCAACGDGFDVITAIEVVEHVDPKAQAVLIGMLNMALKDSGVLILSTPNRRSQFRKHDGHVGVHDPQSLATLLDPLFARLWFEDFMGEAVDLHTHVSPLVAICTEPRR